MKRLFLLLLAALLTAGLLVSCKGETEPPSDGSSGESETEGVTADPFLLSGCKITRGEKSSSKMLSVSREISTTVATHSGVTMMIQDDGNAINADWELLIGETNRTESAQAAELLNGQGMAYVIRRYGKKLVILGSSETVTTLAVRYFLDTLLPQVAAEKKLMLETDYSYVQQVASVSVLKNKSFSYTLVSSQALMTAATMECVQTVSAAVKEICGKAPVYAPDAKAADAQRNTETKEILIGATYYPESAAFMGKISYNQYGISMEGNKIVIYGFSDDAMKKATQMFVDMLMEADGSGNLEIPAGLTLKETDSSVKLTLPAYPSVSQKVVTLASDSTMIYVTNATETAFYDYARSLEQAGMTKHDENQLGTSLFYTYAAAKKTVYAGYDPTTATIRIVMDSTAARPTSEADNTMEKICEPTLTQFRCELTKTETGMSYIIRLEDGRFVIIDGGMLDDSDTSRLWDTLNEQNVRGGDPVIAAWFLSHAHSDHYDTFLRFATQYSGRFVLENAVWNMPDATLCNVDEWSRNFITSTVAGIAGTKVIYAHAGQKFRYGSVSLTVWHTPEELYPAYVNGQNDASVVLRLEIGGQSVMFLADSDAQVANRMVARYGSALKSDFMQIAHHGYSYSTAMPPLFQAIDPSVVLWPSNDEWFHEFQTNRGHNADVIEGGGHVVEVIPAAHGTRVLSFPYTPTPTVLPTYNKGDLIYKADLDNAKYVSDLGWEYVDDLNGRHSSPTMSLQTVDGVRGVLVTGSSYSPVHLVCPDKLANAPVWTLTVTLDVKDLGAGFAIWYNDAQPMEANSPRCLYGVKQTGKLTLTLVNDRTTGTTRVYINGTLAETLTNASNDLGRLMLLAQNAKVFISQLEVRAGDCMA